MLKRQQLHCEEQRTRRRSRAVLDGHSVKAALPNMAMIGDNSERTQWMRLWIWPCISTWFYGKPPLSMQSSSLLRARYVTMQTVKRVRDINHNAPCLPDNQPDRSLLMRTTYTSAKSCSPVENGENRGLLTVCIHHDPHVLSIVPPLYGQSINICCSGRAHN